MRGDREILGEGGEEAEVLRFVGEVGFCGIGGGSGEGVVIDVGHGCGGGELSW